MRPAAHQRLIEPQSIFRATATSHIVFRATDYARTRDFYAALLGLRCVRDDGSMCVLAFGAPLRLLVIMQASAGQAACVDRFGIAVEEFDHARVVAELDRRGVGCEPRGSAAIAVSDPNGHEVLICGTGGGFLADGTSEPPHSPGVFAATAVNHIACPAFRREATRDFYLDMFGMRLAFEDGQKCSVAFSSPEDALYIVPAEDPGHPMVDHLAFSVSDFDLAAAAAKLRAEGHEPEDDGSFAWTIRDPDGYRIQVCAESGVYPGARNDPHHNPRPRTAAP